MRPHRHSRSRAFGVCIAFGLSVCAGGAAARPTAPSALCNAEPDIPACQGAVPSCALCHEATDPPRWNSFGMDLKSHLTPGADFESALTSALDATSGDDSDGDGISNGDELHNGSQPGSADIAKNADAGTESPKNPRYRVNEYDYEFAFRRLAILYCARSPTYEEVQGFLGDGSDDDTLKKRLHQKLTECLTSDYWRSEGLSRLADKRIRPLMAAGPSSNIQISDYRLVIGDYNFDYRLWRYVMTGDRDLRELLRATYHVQEDEHGTLTEVRGILEKSDPKALAGGQPVPEERRAGMLTTQWFLAINTMFSALPRTTAAQAYRAYLGTDIASGEGLRPVLGEPVDVDHKGVAAPRCANCHSTLDPLSYAFAEYEGIRVNADLKFGAYLPERPLQRMPDWDMTKQKSMIFGQPVHDLVEWSKVAAESDEFKRAMLDLFFRHAFTRTALPEEQSVFIALWQSLPGDGYSANRLIHRLIDMQTFGRP